MEMVRTNQRILLLGGRGLIGTHLVEELLKEGYEVTVVDLKEEFSYPLPDHPALHCRTCAVEDLNASDFLGYDVVILLAALLGGVRFFHRYPYRIAHENTLVLLHVLSHLLSQKPCPLLIYFSSSMVFERAQHPVEEEDLFKQKIPLTSYGLQKVFAEGVIRAAHEERGLDYLIVRPFNAVGRGETPLVNEEGRILWGMRHVIPELILKALIKESPLTLIGSGEQVRTFTHCRDIARAVIRMMEIGIRNEDFNLCGSEPHKIKDVAKLIWDQVNPEIPFPGFSCEPPEPLDVGFRTSTSRKARTLLGWIPRYDLMAMITELIPFIAEWWEGIKGKVSNPC